MAKAPKPGADREDAEAVVTLKIEVPDWKPVILLRNNISLRLRAEVERQVGLSVEDTLPRGDRVSILHAGILWWIGRRQSGELVTFEQADADWTERVDTLGDVTITVETPDEVDGESDPES